MYLLSQLVITGTSQPILFVPSAPLNTLGLGGKGKWVGEAMTPGVYDCNLGKLSPYFSHHKAF